MPSYKLRPYQNEAIRSVIMSLDEDDVQPVVSLPTGSGKTIVISELATRAARFDLRVLVLSHVKEILVQTFNQIREASRGVSVGLYSAGLNRKETSAKILVAGIQSIYKNIDKIGKIDLVFIDEAHLVNYNDKSRYRQAVAALRKMNSRVRFIGFTATPFRMRTGLITSDEKSLFNKIVYEKSVGELIDEGFLAPIMSRVVKDEVDTSDLHIRQGEFVEQEVDALVNKEEMIESACEEIVDKAVEYDRKKVLIFTSNVQHAENVRRKIEEYSGETCKIVLGDTKKEERESILRRFCLGSLRYVVNVNVLTTGFDNPKIDLVAIIRPTASPGLYYQMAGRGLRKSDGKDYCLLLDFGQNIKRHGPIDDLEINPSKPRAVRLVACPKCGLIVKSTTRVCPWCKEKIVEAKELPSKTYLTAFSSALNPIAQRAVTYFTTDGLNKIYELADALIDAYPKMKEAGANSCFYEERNSKQRWRLIEELKARGYDESLSVLFQDENFNDSEFRKSSIRAKLYWDKERILRAASIGNYHCVSFWHEFHRQETITPRLLKWRTNPGFDSSFRIWSRFRNLGSNPLAERIIDLYYEIQKRCLVGVLLKIVLKKKFQDSEERREFYDNKVIKSFLIGNLNREHEELTKLLAEGGNRRKSMQREEGEVYLSDPKYYCSFFSPKYESRRVGNEEYQVLIC